MGVWVKNKLKSFTSLPKKGTALKSPAAIEHIKDKIYRKKEKNID